MFQQVDKLEIVYSRVTKFIMLYISYIILISFYINCDIIICNVIYVDLPAPNNVRATVLSHSSVEVMWDRLSDTTEYTISYLTTASHITGRSVTVKGGSTTSHILEHLESNTPYTITVQATTSDGRKSAVSSKVSVIITHAAGKSHTYIIKITTNYKPFFKSFMK